MPTRLLFLALTQPQTQIIIIGCVISSLVLAGIVGSALAAKRRDASGKALCGLALTLGAWFLTFAGVTGQTVFEKSPALALVAGLVALLVLSLLVAGTILAILGILDTHRQPSQFRRGRKRGYLALALVGCFVIAGISGVVAGVRRRAGKSSTAAVVSTGQPMSVDEFNYRITPPSGWSTLEAPKFNPKASAAFRQGEPAVFSCVIAEPLTGHAGVNLDAMAAAIKSNVTSDTTPVFSAPEAVRINGLDGLRLETLVTRNGVSLCLLNWFARGPQFAYQIITTGDVGSLQRVRGDHAQLSASFRLLDPNRVLPASASSVGAYHSPAFGWSVDLRGTWWNRRFDSVATTAPSAEWGITNGAGTACFCVFPLWIDEDEADLDAVANAFLTRFGISSHDEAIFGVKPWRDPKQPQVSGQSMAWEGTRQGAAFLYRFRIVRAKTCSYLLAAWYDTKVESHQDLLDEALDRVKFDPVAPFPPKPERLSARDANFQSLAFNTLGIYYEEIHQLDAAVQWLKRACALNDKEPTILFNYVTAISASGKKQEALAALEKQLEQFRGDQKLALLHANLQFATDDVAGGVKSFEALFDSGYADDKEFTAFVRAACEHNQSDAASAALDRYAKGRDAPRFRKLRALIQRYRHEYDKAIATLAELHRADPEDTDTLAQLVQSTFDGARYDECIGYCDLLIDKHVDAAAALREKGYSLVALKRFRDAKETLEKFCALDPSDAEAKRMLDHLAGMLGQGANVAVKNPISPVALPDEFLSAPVASAGDNYLSGFSAYYRQYVRAIFFEPGHELKTTDREIIVVLNEQGVRSFSSLEFPFDPLSEEIFVNSLIVKNAKGETISTAQVENSYVIDEGGDAAASQRKILHVPAPGLLPGATIECTVTKRETGDAKTFSFRPNVLTKSFPVLRSALVLRAPPDAVKSESTPGLEPRKLKDALCWSLERPEIIRSEPLEAPIDKVLPFVWLSDSAATWAGEAKTYLDSIKDRRTIDPQIRQAAADAVKNLTGEKEKVAAIARLVQRDLAYKGIEFGRRARIPAPAAQTLSNRYGDCKDHALLLSQLLESAGIPARLALVSAGARVREDMPSIDQFNHMIVYLPSRKTGNFIDCTAKAADLGSAGPPEGLATQQALILDDERSHLEAIPDYTPGSGDARFEREITVLENQTDVAVKETLSFNGVLASSMRASLMNVEATERQRALLQSLNAELPTVDLQEAEIENLEDLHAPLRLKLRYMLHQRCEAAGEHLLVRLPAAWERLSLAPRPLIKRYTPFRLWVPFGIESSATMIVPAGWKVELPKSRKIDKPFCAAKLTASQDGRTVHLATRIDQRTGEFPAAQYPAYTDSMNSALGLVEQTILLGK